ncbi:EIF4G [Mytilus coruscus]|uniref:EIF4G n=1 Tax=Mytilus coruscus TaxID=42192 RepID=A0A6J8A3R5_MYTCO|nr:EIF4G [Mytilus coruscus]
MAQIPSRKCDVCKGVNVSTASLYCEECEQSLCKGCNDFHGRFCKDHNVTCKCLTCTECMTSSHNGHTTDPIEDAVDLYRENAIKIHGKLKAKVEILHGTLETIKTNKMRQLQSDYDSYVHKVEKTSQELYGIVDDIKKIDITTMSDFKTIEKQDLDAKRVFFQRHYDESNGTLLQIENLLQESHGVTFIKECERLQKEVHNMIEIDQTLQAHQPIENFSEDKFMRAVIGEIDNRLNKSILKEKKNEIELLTNGIKKHERKVYQLQEEADFHNKELKHKQAQIEELSRILYEKEIKVYELQKEVVYLNEGIKHKKAEIENLSQKQDNDIKKLQQRLQKEIKEKEQLKNKIDRPIAAFLVQDRQILEHKKKQTERYSHDLQSVGGVQTKHNEDPSRESSRRWEPCGSSLKEPEKTGKLYFTTADGSTPTTPTVKMPLERIRDHLKDFVVDKAVRNEEILDWIETNLDDFTTRDKHFLRALMTAVCSSAITGRGSSAKVDATRITARGIILQKYLDHQAEFELEALYALQALVHKLQHPPGVLRVLFDTLYDEDIISEDAFIQWKESKDPEEQEGKGVAMKQVVQFFEWLREADDEVNSC